MVPPQPSSEDKEMIMNEIERIASPLVYVPTLYRDLQEHHQMDWDLIQQSMVALNNADEVRWKQFSAGNEDDIPPGEFVYIPSEEDETDFFNWDCSYKFRRVASRHRLASSSSFSSSSR